WRPIRASRRAGGLAAFLAGVRPSFRRRQRPHGTDALLLGDAQARLLADGVSLDLPADSQGTSSVRARISANGDRRERRDLFSYPPAPGHRACDRRPPPISTAQDRRAE